MDSPTNSNNKKRTVEHDPITELHDPSMELLLGLQAELKEMAAELLAVKTQLMAEVQELKEQLLKDKASPTVSVSTVHEPESTKAAADETELTDDEDSIVADDAWSVMFRQLREYRAINGDCMVPRNYEANKKLAQWVKNQRDLYRNTKMGKTGPKLSSERMTQLEGIGMNWGKKFPAPPSWEERFEEVKKYKAAMRCDPPVDPTTPSPLGMWVSTQRKEYRRFKKGRDALLTIEQIGQLNEIGFDWRGPRL